MSKKVKSEKQCSGPSCIGVVIYIFCAVEMHGLKKKNDASFSRDNLP